MDGILLLLMLTVLAIPVSIIVLFVMIARLKGRVALLEATVAQTRSRPVEDAAPRIPTAPLPEPETRLKPSALAAAAPPADPTLPADPAPPEPDLTPAAGPEAHPVSEPEAPRTPISDATDQNRPLVVRPDRFADLGRWLRDNWVYVVSAASLALAGIFFVQYGVERGLLPPGLRVLGALAFGAALVGAGEWLRRRHGDEGMGPTAFLPSVFSGAGIVTLFAAVLAARQLYGLIGPGAAFAGHLAVAALALVIGWFSGPLLVAVGLIGAALSPFIVGGSSQNVDWLYAYFALIAGVGLGVDALRRWAWVSVLALVLGYGGGFVVHQAAGDAGWIFQLLALVILATILPELRLIPAQSGPATLPALAMKGQSGWPPFPVRLVLGAVLVSTIGLFFMANRDVDTAMLALAALTALALAFLLWADKAEGLDDISLVPSLALLAAIAVQGGDRGAIWWAYSDAAITLRPPESSPSLLASIILAMAVLISAAQAYRALRPGPWGVPFALAAVLTGPLAALLLELLWQPAWVLGPYFWALHVIGLAALMVALALRFAQADAPQMRRAAYATLSALSLIALALFVLTTKTALTLALAVLVVVAAALDRRFRLPEMSLFLQAGAALLGYRLLVDPGVAWALEAGLGSVLLAYGGTIAAMLASLWLFKPLDRPMAKAVAESAAVGLAAILANVLITRWLDQGAYGQLESHWGVTLNAMPWLILMLVQLYRARLGGPLAWLRKGLAGLGGVLAAFGLGMAVSISNPLFSYGQDEPGALVRGPLVLDTLFVAYALPGLILLAAAWRLPGLDRRLQWGFVAIGSALVALYTGLEIRRLWQGDWLGMYGVVQGELYSYTLAMMVVGAGLLYQAIATRSGTLRRIAMAVIAVTVAKVFLLDAAGLTGLTRVVSFAGLGLSLAGLAWLNRWAGSRP